MSELKSYQVVVMLSPKEGREAEFHEWYEHTHIADILRTTEGFTTGQRFGLAFQMGPEMPNSHIAVYDCMAESPEAALADLAARRDEWDMSDAIDAANVARWVLEPLGPKHERLA